MSYDDFWFIDQRVQTRNLRRWLIWFILLFAFVTVGTFMAVKTMYKDITTYEIRVSSPSVTITESKATNVNGYIKGEIKNNGSEIISGGYLCFVLFNENFESVGNEYIEIGTLNPQETKTFEVKFKRDNVDRFIVGLANTNAQN